MCKRVISFLLSVIILTSTVGCSMWWQKKTFDLTVEEIVDILFEEEDTILTKLFSKDDIDDYTYYDGPASNEQVVKITSAPFSIMAVIDSKTHLVKEFFILWDYSTWLEYTNTTEYNSTVTALELELTSKVIANMFDITENEAQDLALNQESCTYNGIQYNIIVNFYDYCDICVLVTTYDDYDSLIEYMDEAMSEGETD